jgi:outer membrane lipoprotein SlyB
MKYLIVFFFLISCAETTAYKVKPSDANVALTTELGVVIDAMPVRIQGNTSTIGSIAGGLIGGIAGEKVGSGTGKELAVITATTTGAVIGYFSTVKLGEHNGYQVTVKLDNVPTATTVIQGISRKDKDKKNPFKVGQRIAVIYGDKVRVVPSLN